MPAPSWLRQKRQADQQRDIDAKVAREIDYFWDLQESNKLRDSEKGGPPRKGWKRLQEEEEELFTQKAGMAQGIDFDKYDEIQVEVNGEGVSDIPICDDYEEVHSTFKLTEWLYNNIWMCHYTKPTPVQKYSVPTGLKGLDMMVCAQTGSGKTAAFLIPIAMSMRRQDGCEFSTRETWLGPAAPLSLVLAPTRELCTQIYDEARKLFHKSGFKASQCYGGVEVKPQLKDLARGCDVLLATPGRLIDFIDRGILTMARIAFLTLDEADRMLDMGFEPQIRQIVEQRDMPNRKQRQTLMFSATFPKIIQRLAGSFLKPGYIWISVGRVGAAADTVSQRFIPINREDEKLDALYEELKDMIQSGNKQPDGITPLTGKDAHKCLIFVGMKKTASWLNRELWRGFRIGAVEIHGDLSQAEREKSLLSFKSGETPIMVATEVAARGLDIPNVSKVINFDLPTQIDDYVHRIGRTGRAGNRGEAVAFFRTMNCHRNNDTDLAPEICQLLEDAEKEIPQFLVDEARNSKNRNKWVGSSGGYGKGKGKASRDHRGGGFVHKIQGGKSPNKVANGGGKQRTSGKGFYKRPEDSFRRGANETFDDDFSDEEPPERAEIRQETKGKAKAALSKDRGFGDRDFKGKGGYGGGGGFTSGGGGGYDRGYGGGAYSNAGYGSSGGFTRGGGYGGDGYGKSGGGKGKSGGGGKKGGGSSRADENEWRR